MSVVETFVAVEVADMDRAMAFYVDALGGTVTFTSPAWTSIHIAGVRVGLAHVAEHTPARTGLHFAVTDLAAARDAVTRAGGTILVPQIEAGPGIIAAEAADTEGNRFLLNAR